MKTGYSGLIISFKWPLLFLLFFSLISPTLSKIGATTFYDGVTYNRNTYVRFNGNFGLKVEDSTFPAMN